MEVNPGTGADGEKGNGRWGMGGAGQDGLKGHSCLETFTETAIN